MMGSKQLAVLLLLTLLCAMSGCASTPQESEPGALDQAPASVPSPAMQLDGDGWIPNHSYYEKQVHYGTTRTDRCSARSHCSSELFRLNTGNRRTENDIVYGTASVKIPYTKGIGGTAGMSMVGLEHDIGFRNFMTKLTEDDLLVFVHGFNTSFTNAAIRCAQLAHDTNFKGQAVFFSWPSAENPATYWRDKKRAEENIELLARFLEQLARGTDKRIHIVAHSMGTYILTNSLAAIRTRMDRGEFTALERARANGSLFNQIILAAPDMSQADYHEMFTDYKLDGLAERITLYSSVNDHVLDVSQLVNYFIEGRYHARLGDSQQRFFVARGMDTVDSRQEISPQFFGHSFYANYRGLVSDMYILLNYGAEPDSRMLQKVVDAGGNTLWFIRD